MQPPVEMRSSTPQLTDLPLDTTPDEGQLDNIKAHLDLILLALEVLANLTSEAILGAVQELNLDSVVSDRVQLWRLRQSNPLRKGSGGRKKLDVEEARSLVLIICYLAQKNADKIRQGVSFLEESLEKGEEPHRIALLGDYLDEFCNTYQERMESGDGSSIDSLSQLAFKLLIDLLFYSDSHGHRRLWLALLDRSR